MENDYCDYSIEYAHIYSNENFGEEQIKSVNLIKSLIDRLDKKKKTYSTVILVDEYNPQKFILNINKMKKILEKYGIKPDYIGYESKLVYFSDYVLKEMHYKEKKNLIQYIKKHQKLPCSLLITVWYLLRLGKIRGQNFFEQINKQKPFCARKLVNILPKKYMDVEKKAFDILKSTKKFKNVVNDIKYIFYN